jgi:copper chaperone
MSLTTTTFAVPDVSCDACRATLEEAIGTVAGVSRVEVDLDGKVVTVEHDPAAAPAAELAARVADQGYEVAGYSETRDR